MKTKLSTLVLTVLAAASAFAGDIFEIRPCKYNDYGKLEFPTQGFATKENPIVSVPESPYYFTVRLQIRYLPGVDLQNLNKSGYKKWFELKHQGLMPPGYDDYMEANRLGIGVYVSGKEGADNVTEFGKIEYAKLFDIVPNSSSVSNFFDCVFEYTPKSGHFALPVRLAAIDKDGMTGETTIRPADETDGTMSYLFCNTDKWEVRHIDATGTGAPVETPVDWSMSAMSDEQSFYTAMGRMPNGSTYLSYLSQRQNGDHSLENVGLYVKTVDFDQYDEAGLKDWEDPAYWHEVPMGEDIECFVKAIADAAGVTEDTTLYAWSEDESVIRVVPPASSPELVEAVEMVTNIVSTGGGVTVEYKKTFQVGRVKILGGRVKSSFRVYGVESNKIAKVVLSPWKRYRYNASTNARVEDYLEIPIKCGDVSPASVELSFTPTNPKASSAKSFTADPSTNFVDRTTEKVPFYITLTQPHTSEVKIGIKAAFNDTAATMDPLKDGYIVLSENGDEFFVNDCCTNVTFAAGETQKLIYIYPLGSDAASKNGIQFTPYIISTGADPAVYQLGKDALLKLTQNHTPVFLSPASPYNAGTVSGGALDGFDVELVVNDCYRDIENTNGIRVVFGGALKGQPETNIVFAAGEPTDLILTGYDKKKEGEQTGTIKIYENGSTTKYSTLEVKFTVAVEKDKLVFVDLYRTTAASSRCEETQFAEGDAIIPMFYVNEPMAANQRLYFFLRPLNEASSNLVSCAAFTQGVELIGPQTNTARIAGFALNFLDGCAATETRSLEYEIFARTAPTLDTGAESVLYAPGQKLILNVANVNPEVQQVKVNGATDAVENNRDAIWIHPVSAATDVPFMAKLADPSAQFDVSNGLMTVWCFTDGRTSNVFNYEFAKITNALDTVTITHRFAYSGGSTQDVAVVAIDKDMMKAITGSETYFENPTKQQLAELWTAVSDKAKPYYGVPYRFRVVVGKRPCVLLSFPANGGRDTLTINENETAAGRKGKMLIELSEPAQEDIQVHVDIASLNEEAGVDKGRFELVATDFLIKEGNIEPNRSTPYNEGAVFKYDTLDGTAASANDGFYVKVTVTTPGWDTYYEYGEAWVYVENTPPVIFPPQPDNVDTNRQHALNDEVMIEWRAEDVKADITHIATPPAVNGLEAHWYDNGLEIAGTATNTTSSTDYIQTRFKLTSGGLHEIRLVVTDKEGENYRGKAERTWLFWISPVKVLDIYPNGPSISVPRCRYNDAAGLGRGRVSADSSQGMVEDFVHTWTYEVMVPTAKVYAWGYSANEDANGDPIPYTDHGQLGTRDVAIKSNGSSWATGETLDPAACYELDGMYDSYFYRWMIIATAGSSGGNGGAAKDEFRPVDEKVDNSQPATEVVELDKYEKDKDSNEYIPRMIAAIFSREYLRSDNCGDINADGIPDRYVKKYDFGVLDENGEQTGNDLKTNLAIYNDDNDFFPLGIYRLSTLIPGTAESWQAKDIKFTAYKEIRGYDEHFNDANEIANIKITSVRRFTDPETDPNSTLALVEWIAYTNYCAEMGWDPADNAHWGCDAAGSYANGWSPERPTDPTMEDTDEDGLPDGYEYYMWYRAHVGELNDGVWRRMTGRRYDPMNPFEPQVITSEEIERVFDPRVPNDWLAEIDTDNDGITDLMEFVLGTNPVDFDTDHDGLPDGYEVYISETDPLQYASDGSGDADSNADGDAMAYHELKPEHGGDPIQVIRYGYTNAVDGVTNFYGYVFRYKGKSYDAWRYSAGGDVFCRGRMIKEEDLTDPDRGAPVFGEPFECKVIIIHFDVYQELGFDPRTGWNRPPYFIGHVMDTKQFTALDEFLVMSYYYHAGGNLFWEDGAEICYPAGLDRVLRPTHPTTWEELWRLNTTDPKNADTDADGMPDGWELYTQTGPGGKTPVVVPNGANGPGSAWSPLSDFAYIAGTIAADPDNFPNLALIGDGIDFVHEYSGAESVAVYTNVCDTIKLADPTWLNKMWPTDPWNQDTDGDGLLDGEEMLYFNYLDLEPATHTSEAFEDIVPGGGLNPLSWDTDSDGLPDPWEAEFSGYYLTATTTTTTYDIKTDEEGNVVTNQVVDGNIKAGFTGGMNGTIVDDKLDYDNDGLLNWQEYMVGAMRGWRYDDTLSIWGNHTCVTNDFENFTDEEWYNFLLNPSSETFNQTFGNERFDMGNYFSCATNGFERGNPSSIGGDVYGKMYMFKDGYYHDLYYDAVNSEDQLNRWTRGFESSFYWTEGMYPAKYCTCDPRKYDTDGDGMDDFYELFHGLNPILGKARPQGETGLDPVDVVSESWAAANAKESAMGWTADVNWWYNAYTGYMGETRPDVPLAVKNELSPYDFFQWPWFSGLPTADPDGDNLRNQQESILANVQAANTYLHTDPSPLWMTDIDYVDSYVHRWYMAHNPNYSDWMRFEQGIAVPPTFTWNGKTYHFSDFPWLKYDEKQGMIFPDLDAINRWDVASYGTIYSVEQNEGYDSDHDYLGDFEEAQGKTKSASDPQVFDDPLRRQAMWFGGKDNPGFLQTPIPMDEHDGQGETGDLRRDFLYYTVECWAKPDASIVGEGTDVSGLHTCVERAIVSGGSGPADEEMLRKNFLIGVNNGLWYTKFDSTGTDKKAPVEIMDGPAATTNWTHIAATYDGEALRLYVDGVCYNIHQTSIMPEHGVSAISVNEASEMAHIRMWSKISGRWLTSILVGASATTTQGVCFDYQWITRSQYDYPDAPHLNAGETTTIADYGCFFKGYIDEVRVWDGARTTAEILQDVEDLTRYDRNIAMTKRQQVFNAWVNGGSRAPTAGSGDLPADLRYHWSFDHIPGAVDVADVVNAPAGFQTLGTIADAKAYWARPLGWTCLWLDCIDPSIQSRVYNDHSWVPWVDNTVSHLPRFDGTTVDSVYWSSDYSGATPAPELGYNTFNFKRTGEVNSFWLQTAPYPTTPDALVAAVGKTNDRMFTIRGQTTIGSNLMIFGGAFPKRISNDEGGMWDGQGAADAWAQTGTDSTHNCLPDWWEEYARENYTDLDPSESFGWDTIVDYHGQKMPAWNAFKRDIAKGMLPDLQIHPEFAADARDVDLDGIPDWWEDMHGVDTGHPSDAFADPDCDGLSNYKEYLIEKDGLYFLNPTLSRTFIGQPVTDYFLQTTNEEGASYYLGELYADHDFMEDYLEDINGFDRTRYDAWADVDEDGWSNFAEMRYAGFKMNTAARFATHYFGQTEVKDFPIPVVHATLRYHGDTVTGGSTNLIYVEAYAGNNLQKSPSAVYVVTPGAIQVRSLYLGEYSERVFHGTLTPGHVQAGLNNIQLEVSFIQQNDNWSWVRNGILCNGTYEEMYAAFCADPTIQITKVENTWMQMESAVTDQACLQLSCDDKTQKGYFYLDYARAGEIDMITGDFSLDLTPLKNYFMVSVGVKVPQMFFRLTYQSMLPTMQNNCLSVSLAEPDSGVLSEGKTAFVAWMDKDGDGLYTPGVDPIGFVKDVDIGWDMVPNLEIEMTDYSQAAGRRFSYANASNDTIRVVRRGVNGSVDGVEPRIIFSRDIAGAPRDYVFEGDFVSSGKFGLDWDNLRADLQAMENVKLKDVTSVEYAVVRGTGSMKNLDTNSVITTFSVEYTSEAIQPTAYSPSERADGIVETARPVFRWTGAEGYTAFRLQIFDEAGSQKLYDSDLRPLPPRDTSLRYTWEAPVFIGTNVVNDAWVLDNHKVYKWRVAMYNAKFSETTDGASLWSDWAKMRTELAETNDKSTLYGSVKTIVKYFGPATNSLDQVVVQLFKNADLTGTPAAQTRLFDVSGDISDLTNGLEVTFHGLADGTYYACAFIDRADPATGKGDTVRQRYETWGYSCQVGLGFPDIWNPRGAKSEAGVITIPTLTVFMEDTDVNGDDLLDWDQDEEILRAASATAAEAALSGDSDGDGLTDIEEGDKSYTRSNKWDSDGDGMPDGWEYAFAGTDPLMPDADKVVAGDLMAYAEHACRVITVRATGTGAETTYIIPGTNEYYVGDNVNGKEFFSTYDYNGIYGRGKLVTVSNFELYNLVTVTNMPDGVSYQLIFPTDYVYPIDVGTNLNEDVGFMPVGPDGDGFYALGASTNVISSATETNQVTQVEQIKVSLGENRVIAIDNFAKVALVHAQVYDEFGYTQTTAVDPADKYTKPFTALDKYLVIRYLEAIGIGPGEASVNKNRLWKYYSLIPGVIDGDGISDITDTLNAANKYGDGISDGWELYVMFGTEGVTNAASYATPSATKVGPWNYADRSVDLDGDGLSLVREYSAGKDPSDPWDAYSVFKLILADGVIEPTTAPFTDAEVKRFGVKGDEVNDDWDLDMISNGQEVWGYYKDRTSLDDICVTNAWSDGVTPDYFRALYNLTPVSYLGEIYNGAEFIEPKFRSELGIVKYTRAGTRDYADTGWDYWSVARYMQSEEFSALSYTNYPSETHDEKYVFVDDPEAVYNNAPEDLQRLQRGGDIELMTHEHIVVTNEDFSISNFERYGYRDLNSRINGAPSPKINLTLKYFGNETYPIVVEAYQTTSARPECGEQLTARWLASAEFMAGLARVTLKKPDVGALAQGATRFLVYIDNDGIEGFSNGDTYGFTEMNVGFSGVDAEVWIGEPNPGLPAFTFADGTNFVSQYKIVRTHINGNPMVFIPDPNGGDESDGPHTVFFRVFDNNANRQTIFPDDYIWWGEDRQNNDAHYIGVDPHLSNSKWKNYLGFPLETVTYEILEGIGPFTVSNLNEYAVIVTNTVKISETETKTIYTTNTVHGIGGNKTFTVHYSFKRDLPDVHVMANQLEGDKVYAAFTVPTDTPATKFWLSFDGQVYPDNTTIRNYAGSTVTYPKDVGFPIPPAANGLVMINLAEYTGGNISSGRHTLQICLGNDMFGMPADPGADTKSWSGEAEFSVGASGAYNGKIRVIAKHPTAALGDLTVAVYDRPDLAQPVAVVDHIESTDHIFDIPGLRVNGKYYVAAWNVNDEFDGRESREVRRPYDTWGYVSSIGLIASGFNALEITAEANPSTTNYIWMQDTDWNDNMIPDREEDFVEIGYLYTRGRGQIYYDDDFDLDGLPDDYEDSGDDGDDEPEEEDDDGGKKITSKDVMAYYEVKDMLYVGLSHDGGDSNLVWCAVVDPTAIDRSFTLNDGSIQLQTPASSLGMLHATYDYNNPMRADASKWQGIGTNVTYDSSWTVQRMRTGKAKFVHAQVYSLFGFNPKTCVGDDDAVNTKDFTRNDKFLVCRYLEAMGMDGVVEKTMNTTGRWIWSLRDNKKFDQDRDSVGDGWELYVMFGPDSSRFSLATGVCDAITAASLTNSVADGIISPFDGRDGQAYSYADQAAFPGPAAAEVSTNLWLKIVQEFDNGQSPTDPWSIDSDNDSVADYVAFYYNVKGDNAGKDDDGDGLSNYAEYLISEVFRFTKLDPKNPRTDGACIDYFRKVGNLYFGEIFTDHDQVADAWEDKYGEFWASSGVFDAFEDSDDDGWSNYAEYKAGTDPSFGSRTVSTDASGTVTAEIGYPIPEIRATVVYNGSASINSGMMLFKSWARSSDDDDPEMTEIPDAIWRASVTATNTPTITYGRAVTYLLRETEPVEYEAAGGGAGGAGGGSSSQGSQTAAKKPSALLHRGWVREGLNTFVVFADLNGDKMYTPGEPFGCVKDVDVRWNSAAFTIELTDTHPVFARLDLTDALNDRKAKYGTESGNLDDVIAGSVSGGDLERVRVIRTQIDGISVGDPILTNNGLKNGNKVVLDKWIDMANCRTIIHEGDFLVDGKFDIDWDDFMSDVGPAIGKSYNVQIPGMSDMWGNPVTEQVTILATSVVYRVVLGNGTTALSDTNNLVATAIIRSFDFQHVKPMALYVDNGDSIVYSPSPTFCWCMPEGVNGYSAFRIQVFNADTNGKVYDSDLQITPPMNNGVYTWNAGAIVGTVLANTGNWKWKVSMYNARFKEDLFSNEAFFSTAVNAQQPMNDHGYSSIGVCVKYTGPDTVLSRISGNTASGKLIVQAFNTPDFAGKPVSAAYVTDRNHVANPALIDENAVISGLDSKGTYYVRAFIDSNGNGLKDDFESWGTAAEPVVLARKNVKPVVGFYIEDADTDGDWMPDAWEYAQASWTGTWEEVRDRRKASVTTGGKVLFSAANFNEASKNLTGISTYAKGASMTIFENGSIVTMLLSGSGLSSGTWTFESIRDAVNKAVSVKENSVKISGVTMDYSTGAVHLFFDAEVTPTVAGATLCQIYQIAPGATSKTVTVNIYGKSSLAEEGWTLIDTKTAEVGVNTAEAVIPTTVNVKGGFYKIEVCE